MPALILFRRGWQFSSDDFVMSSIVIIILRLLCLSLAAVPLVTHRHYEPPLSTNFLKVVYLGFALNILQIILRITMAVCSSRGGIAEFEKRKPVVPLIYINLILITLEISVYSTVVYMETSFSECAFEVCFFLRFAAIFGLFLLVLNLIIFLSSFDSTGHVWRHHPDLWCMEDSTGSRRLNRNHAQRLIANLWHRRIRCLACLGNGCKQRDTDAKRNNRDAMMLVSDMVSNYFMTNLVASDLLAGLLLLRWQTRQWVGCGHRVPLKQVLEESEVYDPVTDPPPHSCSPNQALLQEAGVDSAFSRLAVDWLSIRRLFIYSKFASAVYGRLLYLFSHRLSPRASLRLCKHIRGGKCSGSCCNDKNDLSDTHPMLQHSEDLPMGCCICRNDVCNVAVYQEFTGAPLQSLIYYSFLNNVYQSPFFVAFDDESESIVVAIRGTLSPEDVIVDMLAEGKRLSPDELPADVSPDMMSSFFVHMGILSSARTIRDIILSLQLIEKARVKRPAYPLVICGHSLGAGVACVLAFLLKKYYPEVKAYAYSPPLGLMSAFMGRYCKSFVVSIILGHDLVPRLSIPTLNDVRWRILSALHDCKVPKWRLFSRATRVLGLNCLLPPFCRPKDMEIGLDTYLFDEACQHRLLHPKVYTHHSLPVTSASTAPSSSVTTIDNQRSLSGEITSGSCTVSADRPFRHLEENRSLFRWLRSKTPVLLRYPTTTFGTFTTSLKSSEFSTAKNSDASYSTGDVVSMDTNVRFAGLVVHIVEVNDGVGHAATKRWPLPKKSDKDEVYSYGFRCEERHSCPPVAIWTNSRQFQSILIHPRMLIDHLPDEVSTALYRIFRATDAAPCQQTTPPSPLLSDEMFDHRALVRRLRRTKE